MSVKAQWVVLKTSKLLPSSYQTKIQGTSWMCDRRSVCANIPNCILHGVFIVSRQVGEAEWRLTAAPCPPSSWRTSPWTRRTTATRERPSCATPRRPRRTRTGSPRPTPSKAVSFVKKGKTKLCDESFRGRLVSPFLSFYGRRKMSSGGVARRGAWVSSRHINVSESCPVLQVHTSPAAGRAVMDSFRSLSVSDGATCARSNRHT